MCEYCGCRDIALIGRLSEEHYLAIDALGDLRRAIASGDAAQVDVAVRNMADHLFPHNQSEEAGLFHELAQDEYFCPTVEGLIDQHVEMRQQVERIAAGEWGLFEAFEHTLRHHIDREENGLFPACAVAIDGPTWERIDELTHAFNHEHNREHGHTEADLPRSTQQSASPARTPEAADTEFTLRPAMPRDSEAMVALWMACGVPEEKAAERAAFARPHPRLALLAIARQGPIVGAVLGTWDGAQAWVAEPDVHPEWEGRGVAEALLRGVEKAVLRLQGDTINLLVADPSVERPGYESTGTSVLRRILGPNARR